MPRPTLPRLIAATLLAAAPVAAEEREPITLDAVVVEGEKSGRTVGETTTGTTVYDDAQADQPRNRFARDLIDAAPNVVANEGSFLPTVRGIDGSAGQVGGAAFTTGAQPRVNVVVDGIARPVTVGGNISTLTTMWDVEQVELARGPQSVLGGRNSLAGAVRIDSKDPVFVREGAVRVGGFTQDGTLTGSAMANLPVVADQVALRVVAEGAAGESFTNVVDPTKAAIRDEIERERSSLLRAKLLVTPEAVPGLEVVATYEHSKIYQLFEQETDSQRGGFTLIDFEGANSNTENRQTVYGMKALYELSGLVELEARASFVDNDVQIPNTNSTFDFDQNTESLQGEALARVGRVGWLNRAVAGVAYERQVETAVNDVPTLDIAFDGEIRSIGLFGEAEFGLTDQLALIAGGRVEIDERNRTLDVFGTIGQLSTEQTAFIPRVGLRYDLTEQAAVGYLYSEGFRPGGIDFDLFDPAGGAVTYGSERLRQHEIWGRHRTADGRGSIEAAAFYYTFDDAQTPGAGGPPGGFLFGNVPEAIGYGIELSGGYEVLDGVTLTTGLGLLDTEITDPGANLGAFKGEELPLASNVTFNAGVAWRPIEGLEASARVRHIGERSVALGLAGAPSYTLIDATIGYETALPGGELVRVDAWVENLADVRYVLSPFDGFSEVVGRPRTFGLSGTIRF